MAGSILAGSNTDQLDANQGEYTGKSARRIWWNSYQSRWDGVIPQLDAGSSDDHYICTDIFRTPSFTTIELDDRSTSNPSIYWDDAGKKLHVMSAHTSSAEFWTILYNSSTDTYSFSVGSAGSGVNPTGIKKANHDSPIAITKTPNGHIWLATMSATQLLVQRSSDDGVSWESAAIALTTVSGPGCVDIAYFDNGGTNYVCIYGAENGTGGGGGRTSYFYYIDEGNAGVTTPGLWSNDNASLPAYDSSQESDDHCAMCVDSSNNIYITYKTEGAGENDVKLITRTSAGTWAGTYEVWNSSLTRTRPCIAVKKVSGSTSEEIIISAGFTGDGLTIRYKIFDISAKTFSVETTIFEDTVGTDKFNDSTVCQNDFVCTSDSGFGIITHNTTSLEIWQNTISIAASQTITASFTLTGAAANLTNHDYLLLDSQSLGSAIVLKQGTGETTDASSVFEVTWTGLGVTDGQAVYGLFVAADGIQMAPLKGTLTVV